MRVGRKNSQVNNLFKDYEKIKRVVVPSISLVISKFWVTKNLYKFLFNSYTVIQSKKKNFMYLKYRICSLDSTIPSFVLKNLSSTFITLNTLKRLNRFLQKQIYLFFVQ